MTQQNSAQELNEARSEKPAYVVGIGASAGGLEPLEQFFDEAPLDTGAAFVVIQHLSPDYKSLMDELLARHTAMSIVDVVDGMPVRPNTIYLIPPKTEMTIEDGRLQLREQHRSHERPPMPIDAFFHSLAEDMGNRAIGIILSGTGSDGSRGMLTIHEAGGLTLVQDRETAKFNGMPQASVDARVVDIIAPPDHMPNYLVEYINDPEQFRKRLASDEHSILEGVDAVMDIMRMAYEVDFDLYKPTTVNRRIQRRMTMGRYSDIEDYVKQLRADPDELHMLYRDLLIGVTHFFRDREAFYRLEKHVIPAMFEQERKPDDEIRVWVAGCATGEEAYSIAILLHEYIEQTQQKARVRVFATDVHKSSIEVASTGRYSRDAMVEVSPERLNRYFHSVGGEFQVSPMLRQMITFAQQNVVSDAPFMRMDMVTCRNMLIYFKQPVQLQVLSLLHFALNVNGILFLGPSETVTPLRDEFETIDSHWRIYRKLREMRLPAGRAVPTRTPTVAARRMPPAPALAPSAMMPDARLLRAYDMLLSEYVPAAILLNSRRELVHTFGDARLILHPPEGRSSLDVLEMVDAQMKVALGGAIQRALRDHQTVRYGRVGVASGGETQHYTLVVRPLADSESESFFLLVTFETEQSVVVSQQQPVSEQDVDQFDERAETHEKIVTLEQELQYSKENLQATIEELEASNEELNATNEELVASNEELQSTNEELHSVNEELHTVNAEYQQKITELTQLTDDMNNLLSSTEIGTIFLDHMLRVRKFTPAVCKYFKLRSQDIDRPIADIVHSIEMDTLLEDAERVLNTGEATELEAQTDQQDCLLIRITPYRAMAGSVEGVIISIVDITLLKNEESRGRESELRFKIAFDNAPIGIALLGLDGKWLRVNRHLCNIIGYSERELLETDSQSLTHPDDVEESLQYMHRMIDGQNHTYQLEKRFYHKQGQIVWVQKDVSMVRDVDDNPQYFIAQIQDITRRRQIEESIRSLNEELEQRVLARTAELAESEERFRTMANNAPMKIWVSGTDKRFTWFNQYWMDFTGMTLQDELGEGWVDRMHPDDRERWQSLYNGSFDARKWFELDFRLKRTDGEYRWLLARGAPRVDTSGKFLGYIGSCVDITERHEMEEQIRNAHEELEVRVKQRTAELASSNESLEARNTELDQFAYVAAHDLRSPLRTIAGFGQHLAELLPEENSQAVEYLNRMMSASDRMASLIESLLKFSSVGRDEMKIEDVSLEDCVAAVKSDLSKEINAANAEILTDKLPVVRGDSSMLRQLFQNLIGNAIKYRDGKQTKIEIRTQSHEHEVLISVKDNGIGFDAEHVEKVFEPFQRLHGDQKYRGHGVGLSICRRVVHRHRGRMWAKSQPGKGSTFTFTLPQDETQQA